MGTTFLLTIKYLSLSDLHRFLLAANSHFSLSHKPPTPMFHKHWFFVAKKQYERYLHSLRLFERLSSLSLHNCKHEDFSIWGHISIIIWTTNTFCAIMNIALIFLVWFLHDRQCPLIGLNTVMNYITQFCWKHLAFGFTSYDLPEHYFIELHGGYVLSFVILPVDLYHNSWRINLCNFNLTPWLNVWLMHWRIHDFGVLICIA